MGCRQAVRLALAAALVGAAPAAAYIDIPPATLGRMCDATMSITLVRIEKADGGRVLFRAVRDLKGNGPSDVVKHAIGTEPAGQEIVRRAEVGRSAVHFASASRNFSYTYLDGHWYSATYADGWWRLVRAEPPLLRAFCGTVDELVAA